MLDRAQAAGVERCRSGAKWRAPVVAGVGQPQRVGRQVVAVGQEIGLGQRIVGHLWIVQGGDGNAAGRRHGNASAAPDGLAGLGRCAALIWPPNLDRARHVVQNTQQHGAGAATVAGQRAGRGRHEQRRELAPAVHEGTRIGGQQAAAGPMLLAALPVAAQRQQHPVPPKAQLGVFGFGDGVQRTADQQGSGVAVEIKLASEHRALESGGRVNAEPDADIAALALVHQRRIGQWRAAPPAPDGARVARVGEAAGAGVGADVERVGVAPVHPALGLGQDKAGLDEAQRGQVKFAHHAGVGATAREADQAALPVRRQHLHALPDPVLPLLAAERVQVEQRLPVRLRQAELRQRGAPPEPARVLLVLPEVVQPVTASADAGDAIGRIEQRAQPVAAGRELGPRAQLGAGFGVALPHPVQCGLAQHGFEPGVGVRRG